MPLRHGSRSFGIIASLALLAFALGCAAASSGNLGGIGGAVGSRVGGVASRMTGDALSGDPPITTSLPDAVWSVDSLDNFTPRDAKRPMTQLARTPNGGFVLQPGYYEMHTQSYCLKAGTHGPGDGDGYIYAPTRGPAEDQVMTILRSSVQHPEIAQHDIQTLLWAIIARTKVEDMSNEHRALAARLLSPAQIAQLNRTALDLVPGPALDAAINRMPPLVQQAFRAEAQLRQMLTTGQATYEQLERAAVLAGAAPVGEGSRAVPSGRWSLHPDGYYVRYIPQGYSYTVTQIWVPQGSPAVGKEYDPATHIAVPGNTARQRLVQSGRARPS